MAVLAGCFYVIPIFPIIPIRFHSDSEKSNNSDVLMRNFTIKDYKEIIKDEFKIIEYEGSVLDLADPSPAKLRNLSIDIFENGLSKSDESIFISFFEVKENMRLEIAIRNCNVDRFKPIISFLRGGNTEDRERIEMAAILVNLKSRPFFKFSKQASLGTEGQSGDKDKKTNENGEGTKDIVSKHNWLDNTISKMISKNIIILLVSIFAISGLFTIWSFNDDENCMVWNKDHYEEIPCEKVSDVMTLFRPIVIKKDESLISNFKKIKACDTTSFFKMGKPCIWYGKSFDGSYEYFTAPGLHPETGRTLKAITPYMIETHILKE